MSILLFTVGLLFVSAFANSGDSAKIEPIKFKYSDIYKTKEWQREWRKLKYEAYKLYGAKCCICGKTPKEDGVKLHVDHIRPKSLYPALSLELTNTQILCSEHNLAKGNRDCIDWR